MRKKVLVLLRLTRCAVLQRIAQNKKIVKKCAYCAKQFETTTGKNERTYCSASCASKATVNVEACRRGGRNSVHGPEFAAGALKKREAYKYVKVNDLLNASGIEHEFEKLIGDRVYDLVLTDKKICIEFDGPDHKSAAQRRVDKVKDDNAALNGYRIVRIPCQSSSAIDPSAIRKMIA